MDQEANLVMAGLLQPRNDVEPTVGWEPNGMEALGVVGEPESSRWKGPEADLLVVDGRVDCSLTLSFGLQ